jgi:hypothetical protein
MCCADDVKLTRIAKFNSRASRRRRAMARLLPGIEKITIPKSEIYKEEYKMNVKLVENASIAIG